MAIKTHNNFPFVQKRFIKITIIKYYDYLNKYYN